MIDNNVIVLNENKQNDVEKEPNRLSQIKEGSDSLNKVKKAGSKSQIFEKIDKFNDPNCEKIESQIKKRSSINKLKKAGTKSQIYDKIDNFNDPNCEKIEIEPEIYDIFNDPQIIVKDNHSDFAGINGFYQSTLRTDEKIESRRTYHSNDNLESSTDNRAISKKNKEKTIKPNIINVLNEDVIEIINQNNIFEPEKIFELRKIKSVDEMTIFTHFLKEDLYRELYILLINPISGIHIGKSLIEMDIKEIKFDELGMMAFIVNLTDSVKVDEVLSKLQEYQQYSLNKTRIIIGGGDGSAMPMIDKFLKSKIDLTRCAFGILPIGNSNDFSETLNFKGKFNQ